MQKTLIISLSSLLFTLPLMADSTVISEKGFLITKTCLEKGEFNDCPLEQLTKISATNPLILFQGAEEKAYILDLSEMNKTLSHTLVLENDMIVTGVLQSDHKTLKVEKIEKYLPRPYRMSGVM